MIKTITKLTPKQTAIIPKYIKKWQQTPMQPLNREKATITIKKLYGNFGLNPPEIIFYSSPYKMILDYIRLNDPWEYNYKKLGGSLAWKFLLNINHVYSKIGGKIGCYLSAEVKSQLQKQLYPPLENLLKGSWRDEIDYNFHNYLKNNGDKFRKEYPEINANLELDLQDINCDYYYDIKLFSLANLNTAYFDFAINVLKCKICQNTWEFLLDLAKYCNWVHPFNKVCIVYESPINFSFDNNYNLHQEGKPALEFIDGNSIYAYHGIILPEKYGKLSADRWQAEWLATPDNIEFRQGLLHGIGNSIYYGNICPIASPPSQISFDNQQRLHAEGKPALQFPNGGTIYAYHGVKLPEKYGKVPVHNWQANWLLSETNAELRRVLIQAIGYEKICQELQANKIDTWKKYTLLEINNIDIETIYLLKMICPSTGFIHVIRVPPDMKTAREAIHWINWGIDPEDFAKET